VTVQYPVSVHASVPPQIAGALTNPVAVPASGAIDLDEPFSALITRLTSGERDDDVTMRGDSRWRFLRGSRRAPAAHVGINRRRTPPSEGIG
jgi:hypothetical protein